MTSEWPLKERCAIAGIGATEFSKKSGRSVLALATEATLAAIADAGMTVDEIDGIVRCEHDIVRHNDLADSLGLRRFRALRHGGPGMCGGRCRVGPLDRRLPIAQRPF
jgi:acetyl-CoA acetyltransferase